ncbi:uncharacterized protein IWZ02DRAFT_464338 [Phyllosticta citriasiana]|uniref:uncharacterized protein n=1 Tax=Phyllosticta citriasiana TaxID=595635 RepID=UPI0030FD71FB
MFSWLPSELSFRGVSASFSNFNLYPKYCTVFLSPNTPKSLSPCPSTLPMFAGICFPKDQIFGHALGMLAGWTPLGSLGVYRFRFIRTSVDDGNAATCWRGSSNQGQMVLAIQSTTIPGEHASVVERREETHPMWPMGHAPNKRPADATRPALRSCLRGSVAARLYQHFATCQQKGSVEDLSPARQSFGPPTRSSSQQQQHPQANARPCRAHRLRLWPQRARQMSSAKPLPPL